MAGFGTLIEWAGAPRGTFAIVFTDIVGSTALRSSLRDERMTELLRLHFTQIERLIVKHSGFRVKHIGDGVMALFRTAGAALDFARSAHVDPGAKEFLVRVGIHVGEIQLEHDDIAGIEVHVAARVVDRIPGAEIWLTDRAKTDVDSLGAHQHSDLEWQRHPKVVFKGIASKSFTLWSLCTARVDTSQRAQYPTSQSQYAQADKATRSTIRSLRDRSWDDLKQRPAIAVLPFANVSTTPDQDHLSDGLSEDIINELSSCRMFPVISRNSSFTFKNQSVEIKEIGRRLGARYVMEGSFNRIMHRIRISASLVDATTGVQMAIERIDQDFDRYQELHDQITEMIVGSLAPEVLKAERRRITNKPLRNPTSYEYFLRGQEAHYRYTKTDNAIAQAHLRRAIEADTGNAQAYALLAHAMLHAVQLGWRLDDQHNYEVADQYARQALTLDPRAPFSHFAFGSTSMFLRRIDQALHEMRETTRINPSHAAGYAIMAHLLCYVDQLDDALKSVEWAIRLSPYDPRLGLWLAGKSQVHYFQRDYGESATVGQQALFLISENPIAQRFTAASLGQLGRVAEAEPIVEALRRSSTPSVDAVKSSVLHLYRFDRMVEHMLDGLRKAGLPAGD